MNFAHPIILSLVGYLGFYGCQPSDSPSSQNRTQTEETATTADTESTLTDTSHSITTSDTEIETVPQAPVVYAGQELWDESSIPEFGLILSDESMQSLRNSPTEYVSGSFTYKGDAYGPVAVRTKGSSTWQPIDDKPSLKIKFDKYDKDLRFLDLSELTLNNMVSDYSMMHERVAYRFYREAGVPARRAHHAHLTLNNEDYGLYVNVESATRKMLEPWFDNSGTLWEFWSADFEAIYIDNFEVKFGDDEKLILHETAVALEGNGPIDMEAITSTLDIDSFIRYWAVSTVVAQYDGYPYRYPSDDAYVYHDPESGQLKFLPHGVDETFYYPDWRPDNDVVSRLGWKCLSTPECEKRWHELIWESLDIIEGLDPLPWVDEVQAQIDPYVQSDPKKPYSNSTVIVNQGEMRAMIKSRREQLEIMIND